MQYKIPVCKNSKQNSGKVCKLILGTLLNEMSKLSQYALKCYLFYLL